LDTKRELGLDYGRLGKSHIRETSHRKDLQEETEIEKWTAQEEIMATGRSRWFKRFIEKPNAATRLFCFPPAGAGASAFRTWPEKLPPNTELWAVQLPGREERFTEPPMDRMQTIVNALAEAFLEQSDRPYALFGHSMGSLIAFELVRFLRRAGMPLPIGLFVSGHPAPQLGYVSSQRYDLPDKEFMEELRKMEGTPADILNNPELMEMLLPVMRADFSVCQTYQYTPELPIPCPIVAFGGDRDSECSVAQLELWKEQTSWDFRMKIFPGGHFYLVDSEAEFLEALFHDFASVR
jgi:medium-chain acyl-[acyl-carrier-protein] hydrolase